jgi:hypothetical protein
LIPLGLVNTPRSVTVYNCAKQVLAANNRPQHQIGQNFLVKLEDGILSVPFSPVRDSVTALFVLLLTFRIFETARR